MDTTTAFKTIAGLKAQLAKNRADLLRDRVIMVPLAILRNAGAAKYRRHVFAFFEDEGLYLQGICAVPSKTDRKVSIRLDFGSAKSELKISLQALGHEVENVQPYYRDTLVEEGLDAYLTISRAEQVAGMVPNRVKLKEIARVENGGTLEVVNNTKQLIEASIGIRINSSTVVANRVISRYLYINKEWPNTGKEYNLEKAILVSAQGYKVDEVGLPSLCDLDSKSAWVATSVHVVQLKEEYEHLRDQLFIFMLSPLFRNQLVTRQGSKTNLSLKCLQNISVPGAMIEGEKDINAKVKSFIELHISHFKLGYDIEIETNKLGWIFDPERPLRPNSFK